MNTKNRRDHEVHQNYEYFKTQLPNLIITNFGEYALIRNKEIIQCFSNFSDAYWYGRENYSDNLFSIQEVNDQPITLRNVGHVLA